MVTPAVWLAAVMIRVSWIVWTGVTIPGRLVVVGFVIVRHGEVGVVELKLSEWKEHETMGCLLKVGSLEG